MDLSAYRASPLERLRTDDLLRLLPQEEGRVLDIGARDGHFSRLLAARFEHVTALDLEMPRVEHPRVECVAGDATQLQFGDGTFDVVFCAEVLEHIPPEVMPDACAELERVARKYLLIGVPYKQDLRYGRTVCSHCSMSNPPWGHVNVFDERSFDRLFPRSRKIAVSLVGERAQRTNAVAAKLDHWAGHPYGTYEQEERCIHCGGRVEAPASRSFPRKVAGKLSAWAHRATVNRRRQPNWIHVLLERVPPGR